jgi:hypothetical protein
MITTAAFVWFLLPTGDAGHGFALPILTAGQDLLEAWLLQASREALQ